ATGLGRVRALAGRGLLGHDDLVHQRDVGGHVEDLRGEFDGAVGLATDLLDRQREVCLFLEAGHAWAPPFTALLTITTPPLRPVIAPLISSRPFSASTLCTDRFCVVTRSLPIRPDMRMPLNTRPGVAQPPIEPGRRCTACAPCEAP